MGKYYIDSIEMVMDDGKIHKWKPMCMEDFDCAIDESQIRGGYGNVPKPLSNIELKLLAELKAKI